jgi:hypothetical protein
MLECRINRTDDPAGLLISPSAGRKPVMCELGIEECAKCWRELRTDFCLGIYEEFLTQMKYNVSSVLSKYQKYMQPSP